MAEEQTQEELLGRITELEAQIQSLEKDLIHDGLTGLRTRAFFEEETKIYLELIRNVSAGKRRQWFGFKNLSILFFDIDHFKSINDTYGHAVGDVVLQKVSQTIQKELRHGDTVARWGGEEIVVSLLGATIDDAVTKAEDILSKIRGAVSTEYPDLHVTTSIGVASADSSISFENLIKCADEAMYKAKESGRNRVSAHSDQ